MTTSKREAILAAIETALAGTTGVGNRIYRSRPEAFSRGETPALVIEPGSESTIDPERTGGASMCKLDWRLTVRIGIITRGAIPDQLADPIMVDIHQRLRTNAAIKALVMTIYPSDNNWQQADGDQTAGATVCDWSIRYRTNVDDITS
jgi:hypothetical protein